MPGSTANLIVIERARREVRIGFRNYGRVGIPLTVATLALGAWMLSRARLSRPFQRQTS